MNSQYTEEIATLKREISDLETKLMSTEVKLDLWMDIAKEKDRAINNLQQRNKQLENPRGQPLSFAQLAREGALLHPETEATASAAGNNPGTGDYGSRNRGTEVPGR